MAVTGVGLQPSLYITLLLIFSPVITLFLFVALFLFHSFSLSLSVFHLESFSLSFFHWLLWLEAMLLCWRLSRERKIYSQLFYFFFSSCHNVPSMLKGLDYFCVTCSAFPFSLFLHKAFWRRSTKSVLFSQHLFCSDALWKCMIIQTPKPHSSTETWRWINSWNPLLM